MKYTPAPGIEPGFHPQPELRSRKIEETPENNKILSQVLADEVLRARKARYPSAEDLI